MVFLWKSVLNASLERDFYFLRNREWEGFWKTKDFRFLSKVWKIIFLIEFEVISNIEINNFKIIGNLQVISKT